MAETGKPEIEPPKPEAEIARQAGAALDFRERRAGKKGQQTHEARLPSICLNTEIGLPPQSLHHARNRKRGIALRQMLQSLGLEIRDPGVLSRMDDLEQIVAAILGLDMEIAVALPDQRSSRSREAVMLARDQLGLLRRNRRRLGVEDGGC